METTGWELEFIIEHIESDIEKVKEHYKDNPLCSVKSDNSKFAIIRQHNYYLDSDVVNMFSAAPYGDEGHWGLTLIEKDGDSWIEKQVPIPEKFKYKSVKYIGKSILIKAEETSFLTNINELDRLFPFLCQYREEELTNIFMSLKNDVVIKGEIVWKKPQRNKIEVNSIGTISLNKDKNEFLGKSMWLGNPINITFHVDQEGEVVRGIKTVNELWNSQEVWDKKVKDYAVEELLSIKNENWLDEDEKELDSTQFISRIKLESISIYEEGSFEFFFDDGDLFWEHLIHVSGGIEDGVTDAIFQG